MLRRIHLPLFLCLTLIGIDSLQAQSTRYKVLTTNNVSIGAPSDGLIGFNPDSSVFDGLVADGKRSIYSACSWIGGIDENGLAVTAAGMYKQRGNDFFSGPVSRNYDSTYLAKYDRVWKLSKTQIETHKQQFTSPTYNMPNDIKEWPANGDVNVGESKYLAPFKDLNFNGVYEPNLGEYPEIRGDEALYFIYNDDRRLKTQTISAAFGIEVHVMMYAYDSVTAPELNNSVFFNYKLVNKSPKSYTDLKFGFWFDPDVGNAQDDLVGCDSTSGIFYAYNGDSDDNGPRGYGDNPPAIGGAFLSDPLSGFSVIMNSGSPGALWNTTSPSGAVEHHNYLNGMWKDGSSMVIENANGLFNANGVNGDGYDLNSTHSKTKFLYNEAVNWYESPTRAGDKRALPFTYIGDFNPGDQKCLDLVLVFARDSASGPLASYNSVVKLKSYIQDIEQFYASQNITSCLAEDIGKEEFTVQESKIEFYPNPVVKGGDLFIKYSKGIEQIQMIDLQGKVLKDLRLNGEKQYTLLMNENLKSGLYLVLLKSADQQISTFKINVD
jgi:hypothetical protein